MRRRALLSALGCGALPVAGCASTRSPEVALASVVIVNDRRRSIEVEVSIEKNGSARYRNTHLIPGRETDDNAIEITGDWMGERVPYSITVEVVRGSAKEKYSTSDAEEYVSDWGTNACFDPLFTIGPSNIRVSLGANESC